ncbi:MAG: hypothetical protein DCC73_04135 [Proteobacteria bacterium]|jgi:hypothetical protein|nr:MAG: hypothetical protein DCC73_04135 [Pseudomonadota bacterium]
MYPTNERRLVARLQEYWNTMRGERAMPALANLRFRDFGPDIEQCVVVAVGDTPDELSLIRVGATLKPYGWRAAKGSSLADCPPRSLLGLIVQHVGETVRSRTPLHRGGHFTNGGARMLGRAILLPLSDDGVRVTHVLAGVNYKKAARETAAGPVRTLRPPRLKRAKARQEHATGM